MRLMCLAGAYAGQVQEYGAIAGLAALTAGTAARIENVGPVMAAQVPRPAAATAAPTSAPPPKRRSR